MHYDDLQIGIKVKIIDFGGDDASRPEHWSSDMDEWQGAIVTIADFDNEYVYIKDDGGEWSWHWFDFELYCDLKPDNPNIIYRKHKSEKIVFNLRTKWALEEKSST